MIDILFEFAGEIVLIKIDGKSVQFGSSTFGAMLSDISGLKLDYKGVCREHPDLETNEDWREEAIKRFKKHIKKQKTEEDIEEYCIQELKKMGYTPFKRQKYGFRPQKI